MVKFTLLACSSVALVLASQTTLSASTVEILRDQYGTPHVYADSNYGVYYGYGYAVAEDRMYQMEMLRRTVEGKVAEVLGEKFLSLDSHIRTSYDHRAISQQLETLAPDDREVLRAYADGFNQRVKDVLKNPTQLMPKEFLDNDFMPQLWRDYDVAMLFAGSIAHRYSDFNSELDNLDLLRSLEGKQGKPKAWSIFNASKWLLDKNSPTTVPRSKQTLDLTLPKPSYLDALNSVSKTERVAVSTQGGFIGVTNKPEVENKFEQLIAENGYGFSPEFSPASNFWAVGNKRAEGAKGILVNGPQFGWGLPSYVYGIGLHGGDFEVVGNTLLALPGLLFAHNNKVSWGSTAGLSDQVDVYVEKLNPENSEQYLHDGRYKNYEQWSETIQVKNAKAEVVTARRSVHGMVQKWMPERSLAYSRARAWEGGELKSLMAWVNLAKKKTLGEVQASLSDVTTNINFYYMDNVGNLGYTHGGRYPKRAPGHDSRLPVDGSGQWDWQGYLSYQENPNVRNPAENYLANWNNRPAENWGASDLWPYTWSRGDRSKLLQNALAGDKKLSRDQVWGINQKVSRADVSLPFLKGYLTKAWQGQKLTVLEQTALTLIERWDQQWQADDQGQFPAAAAITAAWFEQLLAITLEDDVGEENFPLYRASNTPDKPIGASMGTGVGIKVLIENLDALSNSEAMHYDFFNGESWQSVVRKSFTEAVVKLEREQGEDVGRWSLKALPMVWQPFNFRGVPQAATSKQKIGSYMNRGSENNLFLATGTGFKAFDVIAPGQSGFVDPQGKQASSYSDQMDLFRRYQLKPVPFKRADMEAITAQRKILHLD